MNKKKILNMENVIENYFIEKKIIISKLDFKKIEHLVDELVKLRSKKGRLIFLGIGGSAGNCSHAVNDFRKLCGIESYCPTDNVSEITARTNDDGFETIFSKWLKVSNLNKNDALFIMSVGGGDKKKNVSVNLINAIKYAKKVRSKVFSIVGKKEGFAYVHSNISIFVDVENKKHLTPHAESFQTAIWHSIVSHPKLQIHKTKW